MTSTLSPVNHYKTLGITANATLEEVKKSYHKLAKEYHPDKNSSPHAEDKFKQIKSAYETLSDTNKKLIYDLSQKKPAEKESTKTSSSQNCQSSNSNAKQSGSHPKTGSYSKSGFTSSNWSKFFQNNSRYTATPDESETDFDFSEFCQETPRTQRSSKARPSTRKKRTPFHERPPWDNQFAEDKEESAKKEKTKSGRSDEFTFRFEFRANFDTSEFRRSAAREFTSHYSGGNDQYGASFHFWFGSAAKSTPSNSSENSENEEEEEEDEFDKRNKRYHQSFADACVQCKYCATLMDVESLIKHEPRCSKRYFDPDVDEEIDIMDPRRWKDWRDIHSETLNSIRRDKRRLNMKYGKDTFEDDPDLDEDLYSTSENPDLLRCPYCYRSFNKRAAATHVPFCRNKWTESGGRRAANPLGKPVSSDYASKNARAKEYARTLNRPQFVRKTSSSNLHGRKKSVDETPTSEENIYSFESNSNLPPSGAKTTSANETAFPDIGGGNKSRGPFTKSARSAKLKQKSTAKMEFNFEVRNSREFGKTKLGAGCATCQAKHGAEAAQFVCSCGARTAYGK